MNERELRARLNGALQRANELERRLAAAMQREGEWRYLLREVVKATHGERSYDDELRRQVERMLRD